MEKQKAQLDKALLSCLTQLESFEEVSIVDWQLSEGCTVAEISGWEAKNCPYVLPADFKAFYSMFNGIKLSYKVEIAGKHVPLGEIRLNKLEAIARIALEGSFPSMTWLRTSAGGDASVKNGSSSCSSFETGVLDLKTSAAFSIDCSSEIGEVVLLYRSPDEGAMAVMNAMNPANAADSRVRSTLNPYEDPEVWFQDISARWHFVSPTFTNFLRLMVTHFGIYGWQYAYTPEGLPSDTIHWMGLFCKEVRENMNDNGRFFPLPSQTVPTLPYHPIPPPSFTTVENLCRLGLTEQHTLGKKTR